MSALSDLQKKLEKESQGIMFPFIGKTSTVNTNQKVYNSASNSIMSMKGKKYVGPDAVIQYGSEEEGFARQLKQIEAPMLPQFDADQFPKAGEGIMQTPTPASTSTSPTTSVESEGPAMDPCPPGFKFDPQLQRCVPIEQPKSDRPDDVVVDNRRNIGDIAKGLGVATDALNKAEFQKNTDNYNKDVDLKIDNNIPWLNFIPLIGKPLNAFLKSQSDKQLKTLGNTEGISVTENQDGTLQLKITNDVGKRNFARLQTQQSLAGNMASTQKKDASGNIMKAPNGQNMIVGPITLDYFGKGNLFTPENQITMPRDAAGNIIRNEATEAAFRKKLQDRTQTVDALNAEEKNKLLSELDAALGLDSTVTAPKPVTVDPESTAADAKGGAEVPIAFGQLKDLNEFGQLIRNNEVAKMNIENSNVEMDMMETLYRTGKAEFLERNDKFIEEQEKQEEARKEIQENNKKIDEKIKELGMNDSQAQEQGFKDSREQFEFRVKASQEANQRAEGRRTSQSQFTGGKSFKGGATATGTTRCFHPDTDINGKKIKDIKAGDYINDSLVEGMVQFKMNNPYYLIDGIKVSGSHGVLHDDKWIFVADHPESKEVEDVTEFVYVPIVEGGTFKINNTTYADYDYHDIVVLGDDEWKKRRGFK